MKSIIDFFKKIFGINSRRPARRRDYARENHIRQIRNQIAPSVVVDSARMYSTGPKGKVYISNINKSCNHNLNIEVKLRNVSNQAHWVTVSTCIYDYNGTSVNKGDVRIKIQANSPHTLTTQIDDKNLATMHAGKYKLQLWLNDKKITKLFFSIYNR